MSALDEIKKKKNHELSFIEYLIIENENRETTETIDGAASELAAKDEQIAALQERVEKLEKVQVIAESVNQWLIQNELGNTAHQRQLAEALQEAQ